MTAPPQFLAHQAAIDRATTFRAWRVGTTGTAWPLDIGAPEDWQEALNEAQLGTGLQHKDTLLIHMKDAGRNRGVLRSYAIKQQSKPIYRKDPATGLTRPERPLYADLSFECAVAEFEPERPFDAFRDPASGRDPQLLEQRA